MTGSGAPGPGQFKGYRRRDPKAGDPERCYWCAGPLGRRQPFEGFDSIRCAAAYGELARRTSVTWNHSQCASVVNGDRCKEVPRVPGGMCGVHDPSQVGGAG